MLSDQDTSLKNKFSLEDSLKMLKGHVKSYVSESIKSTNSQLPDIRDFDLQIEISKIHPVLWNFIFRMTASEDEEKMLRKDNFDWEYHYVKCSPTQRNIESIRFFPRLFTSSCIFNTFHSHCTQPLHLLMTDIVDKYSGSSSDLLLINSKMGAGVSKDTLKRYINNKCIQLNEHDDIHSETFVMASFDNLDKNQSYAMVGAGKDRSGFHGTTIQAIYSNQVKKTYKLN